MSKEMKEYIATVKRLKKLTDKILDNYYYGTGIEDSDKVNEVHELNHHIDTCLYYILK